MKKLALAPPFGLGLMLVVLVLGALISPSATNVRQTPTVSVKLAQAPVVQKATPHLDCGYATPQTGLILKGGPHHPGSVYFVTWNFCGKGGYVCLNFSGHASDGYFSKETHGKLAGYTAENSKRLEKLANAWPAKPGKRQAAKEAADAWMLSSSKAFHADLGVYKRQLKAKGLWGAVQADLRASKAHAPYKVVGHLDAVNATGSFRVTGNGLLLAHQKVRITATGAKLVKAAAKTNAAGVAAFSFTPAKWGKVSFKLSGTTPSSSAIRLTNASPGRQHLARGHFVAKFHGQVGYTLSTPRPTQKSACGTNCTGNVPLHYTVCNKSAETLALRLVTKGGSTFATLKWQPGQCATKHTVLNGGDTKVVVPSVAYFEAGKRLTPWKQEKAYPAINCPPAPQFVFTVTCDCGSGSGSASVTSLASSTRIYLAKFYLDGTVVSTVTLTNGTASMHAYPKAGPGDELKVMVTAAGHNWSRGITVE